MKPFKSINLFRLPEHCMTIESISELIAARPFTPCGPGDMETRGFVPPAPHIPDQMTYFSQQAVLIHLQTETKIIPKPVVKRKAQERIDRLENEEERKIGHKERKDIEEFEAGLLQLTAFTKITTQRAIIDLQHSLVMIEASSAGKAEDMLSALREALGRLNTKLVQTEQSPISAMTEWLEVRTPDGFEPGCDCELKQPEEGGAIARCLRQDLYDAEVKEHLLSGKLVTKLALEWQDKISFHLTENLGIKRVKFMDILQDDLQNMDVDTQDVIFEAPRCLSARFAYWSLI